MLIEGSELVAPGGRTAVTGLMRNDNLDREASLEIARRVRAQFRRCWRNAAIAVRHLGPGAEYVEGWIVVERSAPLVVEHGWCEVDGRVIDPTYTPYVSNLPEPAAYFAGLRLPVSRTGSELRGEALPIAWRRKIPAYQEAFEQALRASRRGRVSPLDQPTRVVNCRVEPFDVFIGRTTEWGNPFRIGPDGNRQQVIEKFRDWIIRRPSLLRSLESLRGKTLGCFCAPAPCHGDVLAALADLN